MNILIMTPYSFIDGRKEGESITSIFEDAGHSVSHSHNIENLISRANRQWDTIWMIGHGAEEGFQFNGSILSYKQLVPIVSTGGTSLLFINSCNSILTAVTINEILKIDVVATISNVRNDDATLVSTLFATNLVRFNDPEIAYAKSSPGLNRDYVFLRGRPSSLDKIEDILEDVRIIKKKIIILEYNIWKEIEEADTREEKIKILQSYHLGTEGFKLSRQEWIIILIGLGLWVIAIMVMIFT